MSAKSMDEATRGRGEGSQEWTSVAVGREPGRAKAGMVVPSDVSFDSHDLRK